MLRTNSEYNKYSEDKYNELNNITGLVGSKVSFNFTLDVFNKNKEKTPYTGKVNYIDKDKNDVFRTISVTLDDGTEKTFQLYNVADFKVISPSTPVVEPINTETHDQNTTQTDDQNTTQTIDNKLGGKSRKHRKPRKQRKSRKNKKQHKSRK